MAAEAVGIYTIAFPDPYLRPDNKQFATLPSNISFQYIIRSNIQTLSTKNVEPGTDPYGILFVPDLQSDGCKSDEGTFVPTNATRMSNLPRNTEYDLVAIAPWFSKECMLEYFAVARTHPGVKSFLVYLPGNSSDMPPILNDASWVLGDGGSWQSANQFPTYALDSLSGHMIVENLSLYSGNITDAPHGHDLASMFSPTDYVRLWANINTESENQLPSLWVFLVVVLGLLIIIVGSTSCGMHLTQRRRRNNLRQRVINGEVDLEAIGVKRLTVPRDYLEKLPLYTYSAGPDVHVPEKTLSGMPAQTNNIPSPTIEAETDLKTIPLTRRSSAPPATTSPETLPAFSQPTCPICLDDFEPNESQIRELPCQHIFHVDCIDTFLISNSSLCPMCKKSVLPTGYCPATITNLMVRRERNIRRIQERATVNQAPTGSPAQTSSLPTSRSPGAFRSLGSRLGQTAIGRRVFSAPERSRPRPSDIEMSGANPVPLPVNSSTILPLSTPEITPAARPQTTNVQECTDATTHHRREWARQRALTLLGNRIDHGASEEEATASTPAWRRGLRRMFPGFR